MAMVSIDRSKQKPLEGQKELQVLHGLSVQSDETGSIKSNGLLIKKGQIRLALSGSSEFSEILVEGEKVTISQLKIRVFHEKPWQWVYDFCGKGIKPQIKILSCEVTVSDNKVFDLGAFEITKVEGGLLGQCKAFTVQQTNNQNYSVKGNLSNFISSLGVEKDLGFLAFKSADTCKEMSGVGEINLEIQNITGLFTMMKNPFIVNAVWRGSEVSAQYQVDNFGFELKLGKMGDTLRMFYKNEGVDLNGTIEQGVETYQLVLGPDKSLDAMLKQGGFAQRYKLPEEWQNRLGGIYESKHDIKAHRLQITLVTENKSIIIDEVK